MPISIAQPRSRLHLKDIIETGKVLIVALPQGQLGIEKSAFVGSLILSQLHLATLTADTRSDRPPFHIYVDECHHFGASTLPEMLSGIRKFGVSLVLAHQYLGQLPIKLKAALLGTVGTIVAFRIGANDVGYIEPEFQLKNQDPSLCELQPFAAYARTGLRTHKLAMPEIKCREYPSAPRRIRNFSRSQYAVDRALVEERLARFIAGT